MNATKVFLFAMVALIGTVGAAGATEHACSDKKGNPHYCWQPDVDPTFTITTQTATANVTVNHVATVQTTCDADGAYAVSGGYKVMPKDATAGYVVRAKVLNNGPIFSAAPEDSTPNGWTVTVVNRGFQAAVVTTYVTCIQPS